MWNSFEKKYQLHEWNWLLWSRGSLAICLLCQIFISYNWMSAWSQTKKDLDTLPPTSTTIYFMFFTKGWSFAYQEQGLFLDTFWWFFGALGWLSLFSPACFYSREHGAKIQNITKLHWMGLTCFEFWFHAFESKTCGGKSDDCTLPVFWSLLYYTPRQCPADDTKMWWPPKNVQVF